MKVVLFSILAFLAGVVVTMLALTGIESLIPIAFSLPSPSEDPKDLAAYIEAIPLAAKLAFLASYLIAGTLGGYVCTWVGPKPSKPWATVGVAAVYTAGGIMNFAEVPSPMWVVISAMVLIVTSPFLGYSIRK